MWSPQSLGTALSLLALGSRGTLRHNLVRALVDGRRTTTGEERDLALRTHLSDLDSAVLPPAPTDGGRRGPGGEAAALCLASVNDLYLSAAEPALPSFEALLRARPGAGVHTVDFAADPERVRTRANAAVARVTRGLVPEALPEAAGTDLTVRCWESAHGGLHWANVATPLCLADWNDWGVAPRGLDAATLHAYALARPEVAGRIRALFADLLEGQRGRVAHLVVCARIVRARTRDDVHARLAPRVREFVRTLL